MMNEYRVKCVQHLTQVSACPSLVVQLFQQPGTGRPLAQGLSGIQGQFTLLHWVSGLDLQERL